MVSMYGVVVGVCGGQKLDIQYALEWLESVVALMLSMCGNFGDQCSFWLIDMVGRLYYDANGFVAQVGMCSVQVEGGSRRGSTVTHKS